MKNLNELIFKTTCDFFGNDDFVEEMSEDFKECSEYVAKALAEKYEFNVK